MLIVIEVLALIALLAASDVARRAFLRLEAAKEGSLSPEGLEAIHAHLADLTEAVGSLEASDAQTTEWRREITLAVDEGIRHVDRAENRVRAVVRRAKEKLEENGIEYGAIEAEASELRIRDGGGSDVPRVHPVPTDVGSGRAPFAGIPGYFSPDHIQALRGN